MRTTAVRLAAAGLVLGSVAALGVRPRAAPPPPVLVELFTSEGCSDCPPADVLLERLIASPPIAGVEIVGLGNHVDYWDRLGWKDRFSSAVLTNRQQMYGARFNLDSVYTPQMIVDGRLQLVGSDAAAARRAIEQAAAAPHGVVGIEIDAAAGRTLPASARADVARSGKGETIAVRVTADRLPQTGRGDRADVVVAITEDRLRTEVKRGENHGRTLTHAAVVRSMTTIGRAAADGPTSLHAEIPLGADWQRDQVKIVAFVQEQRSGTILSSASVLLQNARR